MTIGSASGGFGICLIWTVLACGQTATTTAEIDRVPLELTMPERYQMAPILEPIRKVSLVAPRDGLIRSLSVPIGAAVREMQEVAELDRTESGARLKIALAEVKEMRALAKRQPDDEVAQAHVEAAQARAELAQLELDRCTLRAPFGGRVLAIPVSTGQYVLKGAPIVEIADTTTLKVLQPVNRRVVTKGSSMTVQVEDKEVAGKVQSIVPLPEAYLRLRELAAPFAAAWVFLPNPKGEIEPGLRLRPSTVPATPIAAVARRALKKDVTRGGDASMVQVLRNQFVTNLPIQVLGDVGPDRVQIAGPFYESDILIVSSSVPLIPGTLIPGSSRGRASASNDTPSSVLPPRAGSVPHYTRPAARAPGESAAPY